MPHVTVEYTDNLPDFEPRRVLHGLYEAMMGSGQFGGPDIKGRALPLDCYQLGDGSADAGFVHVTLRLLTGRTPAIRKDIAERMAQSLAQTCPPRTRDGGQVQFTVDVREMDRELYAKRVSG